MERVRPSDPRDGCYRITPADAARLLENGRMNRPLSESRARKLAARIRQGKWIANGETIILDYEGNMIDGQHRCRACVIAGKSFDGYMIFLPKSSGKHAAAEFDTIDSESARRTAGDRLAELGVPRYMAAAATVRLAMIYEMGVENIHLTGREGTPTIGEIRTRYQQESMAFDEATHLASRFSKKLARKSPASLIAFVAYWGAKQDPHKPERFIEQVATGIELGANSPALALRNRLESNSASNKKMQITEMFALWVKSYCMFRDNRTTQSLRWNSNEKLPRFETTKYEPIQPPLA